MTDPIDAIVAEAMDGWLHDKQSNCDSVPLRISATASAIRAAVMADRLQRADRAAALEEAFRIAVWEPYLPDPHLVVCRDCRVFEGMQHLPSCELGLAWAAISPTPTDKPSGIAIEPPGGWDRSTAK